MKKFLCCYKFMKQRDGDINNNFIKKLVLSNSDQISTRWKEICHKIQVDPNLDEEKKQLWKPLECYQDVFSWNKGELGYCTLREHDVDSQGISPCKVLPG